MKNELEPRDLLPAPLMLPTSWIPQSIIGIISLQNLAIPTVQVENNNILSIKQRKKACKVLNIIGKISLQNLALPTVQIENNNKDILSIKQRKKACKVLTARDEDVSMEMSRNAATSWPQIVPYIVLALVIDMMQLKPTLLN